ncbi:xylose ABC transporter ATP-binding protein [Effusibacillus pohliae]|uniref:xylose ABC transporter ATP-binding protein n=1 Tax=Effusibacillus pohliae TaxID=232270 RepID=UPI00038023AB|nr:xylose ABC transporter ATP-binding protein [Effusibacillus pohliae]
MNAYALEMENISKQFPGVKALDRVTFKVAKGEIHAICGENGAGKSTLMKILSGFYPHGTYDGTIRIHGQEQMFRSIKDAEQAGIAIIYQELALVKELSVAENMFLGNELATRGIVNWHATHAEAGKWLERVGLQAVDPRTMIGQLGIGKQQLVEIAKALAKRADILILDEPTAALTEREVEVLLDILQQLKREGVTCIYISHKLNEVFQIADSVTVLRDGQTIATRPAAELTEEQVISLMVGRELTDRFPPLDHEIGDVVMMVEAYTVPDPELPGRNVVDRVHFQVRAGEILGIAGLMGSGRTELAMSLFGEYPARGSGKVTIDGRPVTIRSASDAIRAGIALVTEDRKRYGLVLNMDIKSNITLSSLRQVARGGVIETNGEIQASRSYVRQLRVKTPSIETIVGTLSGGNQQKVVLAKALMTRPKVLILDEPTRGIDVGAKYEIYQIINELAKQGVAIILISSELPEVIGMSDRILVMNQGRINGEFTRGEATQEKIMQKATGGK